MSTQKLTDEIKHFRRKRKWLIPVFITLGLFGLVLPILPGWALIFLGLLLIFPKEGENLIKKVRDFLNL